MPTTFVKRSTVSDLSAGGHHNNKLLATTAAAFDHTINLAAAGIAVGHHFTEPGIPGATGVTGIYTVEVAIAIGDSSIEISVAVGRVNSSGTLQQESALSAQQVATGAVQTHTFVNLNLGTWAAGDRLRIRTRYVNTHQHTGRSVTENFNTTDSQVVAPWSTAGPVDLAGTSTTQTSGSGVVACARSLSGPSTTQTTGTGALDVGGEGAYLLTEAGDRLVTEAGDGILLESIDAGIVTLSGTSTTLVASTGEIAVERGISGTSTTLTTGSGTLTGTLFTWKGLTWQKRTSIEAWGPTFNSQWDAANVVHNDINDVVLLRITNPTTDSPYAAEVRTLDTGWGYGTYICTINRRMDDLYKAVVWGGMFTYDENNPPGHNEIDACEASAWGGGPSGTWDVAWSHVLWFDSTLPPAEGSHSESFTATADVVTTHVMKWELGKVTYDSYVGQGTSGTLLKHTEITSNVPTPANENLRFNLWVFDDGLDVVHPEDTPETTVELVDFAFIAPGVEFSGTSSTSTSGSGSLDVTGPSVVELSGTSTTATSGSGALSVQRSLSGTSTTATSGAGSLTRTAALAGTSTTTTTGVGSLARVAGLAGTSTTTTSGTGELARLASLTGPSTTQTTGSGSLDIAGTVTLAGTSTTQTSGSGALSAGRPLAGISTTTTTSTGALARAYTLAGTTTTSTSGAGTLARSVGVSGISATTTTGTGELERAADLAGTSTTTTAGAGALELEGENPRPLALFDEQDRPSRHDDLDGRPHRHQDTSRPPRHDDHDRPARHTATTRPRVWPTSTAPARHHPTVRPPRWHHTIFVREEQPMSLTIVPFGPYTQHEIAEPLYVRVHETLRDGTTAPLELHGQTPPWTAEVSIQAPGDTSAQAATRACTIVDPADLPTVEPQNFDTPEDGWVRVDWQDGDFAAVGDYQVQLTLDNGTLRLKSTAVYQPQVADGPAALVGAPA